MHIDAMILHLVAKQAMDRSEGDIVSIHRETLEPLLEVLALWAQQQPPGTCGWIENEDISDWPGYVDACRKWMERHDAIRAGVVASMEKMVRQRHLSA